MFGFVLVLKGFVKKFNILNRYQIVISSLGTSWGTFDVFTFLMASSLFSNFVNV